MRIRNLIGRIFYGTGKHSIETYEKLYSEIDSKREEVRQRQLQSDSLQAGREALYEMRDILADLIRSNRKNLVAQQLYRALLLKLVEFEQENLS
jgi:hypothetical protein